MIAVVDAWADEDDDDADDIGGGDEEEDDVVDDEEEGAAFFFRRFFGLIDFVRCSDEDGIFCGEIIFKRSEFCSFFCSFIFTSSFISVMYHK
jgi:hypothetical protein